MISLAKHQSKTMNAKIVGYAGIAKLRTFLTLNIKPNKTMKNKTGQTLLNYINAQSDKDKLKPFNPDAYQWQAKGTKWKQFLVILLSPLSCILVWLWLAFLSSK